ncbi:hypothetical protein L1279_003490 [Planomicrobium sp. HSC-17F08]|nr:hypothetical protein [Planomicrobium sp. HSC-17F08]
MFVNSNGYNKLYKEDNKVSDKNVEIYVKLNGRNYLNFIKNIMLFGFLITFIAELIWDMLFKEYHFKLPLLSISRENEYKLCVLIFISILLNHTIAYVNHKIAYKSVLTEADFTIRSVITKKDFKIKSLSIKEWCYFIIFMNERYLKQFFEVFKNNYIYLLISPDYFYALYYKDKLKKGAGTTKSFYKYRDNNKQGLDEWDKIKIERKFFIEYSNWLNVSFITVSTILIILIRDYNISILEILFYFLLFRLLSRSIEIVIAYYKDVVRVDSIIFKKWIEDRMDKVYINNWKSSAIRKPARISLACHTLFEMILTFTLLYCFVSSIETVKLEDNLHLAALSSYWEFLVYSLSINTFNFSYTLYPNYLWSILHVAQVFIGVVLIVLSLARYLGLSDEITERDEKFFIDVEDKKAKMKINNNLKRRT